MPVMSNVKPHETATVMAKDSSPETPVCWWRFLEEYEAATTLLHLAMSPPDMTDPAVFLRPVPLLLAAGWEAFHVRCVNEATAFVAGLAPNPSHLPKLLLKQVAQEVREEKQELAPWRLSGEDWRAYLVERADIKKLYMGSGKSHHIDEFYKKILGLEQLSSHWKTRAGSVRSTPSTQIDLFIKHRDSVVHRGEVIIDTKDCWNFYGVAVEQVIRTIQAVTAHVLPSAGSRFSEASMRDLRRSLNYGAV